VASYLVGVSQAISSSKKAQEPAFELIRALGVDPALVVEVVAGGPLDSGYFQSKAAAILKEDYTTSFSVDNGLKDTRLVVEALAGTGVHTDMVMAGLARFERAIDGGHGGKDIAASFLAS
jgi:3-hydroxyisobutyrate dehydrogenase